jgi:capsular polysaccharide biosynthesis protein
LLESVQLFNGAKVVVGLHGAALSNIIFCEPNRTSIVEIAFYEGYDYPVGHMIKLQC